MASPPTGFSDSTTGPPVSQTIAAPNKDHPPGKSTAPEYRPQGKENIAEQELEESNTKQGIQEKNDSQEHRESGIDQELEENNTEQELDASADTDKYDSATPDLVTENVSISTNQNVDSAITSSSNDANGISDKDNGTAEKEDNKKENVVKSPTVRFSSCSKGDNSEEVEVIEFTHTEIMDFNTNGKRKCCGPLNGPHIVLFTIFCLPAALFISLFGAFYYGALTWYNLLTYVSEEKRIWHKIFISPIIILSFPVTVGLTALIISVCSAFVQISWSFTRWREVILDVDKGFYGWLCDKLSVPMCSPYDSVIIHEDSELEPMRT
ncbi:hypothetical protein FSP39_008737 [Pinctada imbricata]|uniref:Transmembrane protein 169 n=1 Tax=Pinctada imbricata TaxID=66713 RepID=A0AA88YI22_PINIB|nr:hypothetical protein FSP39_008737 [Pinctada imbricata]